MLQCLLKHIYLKRLELMLEIFNVIVCEVCHLLDQSKNTVFLAVASVFRVDISVAITLISAVKEAEQ